MGFADFGMKAGRLFGSAAKGVASGVLSFGAGAAKEAIKPESPQGAAVTQVKEAAQARTMTAHEFGKAPWYGQAILSIGCGAIVAAIFAYETNNLIAMFEMLGNQHSKVKIFGYSPEIAISVILMAIEHYFGFLLLFSKTEISFLMRRGMDLLCYAIAAIIIASNFTSLEKRDLIAKKQAENQTKIFELAKAGQMASARVAAGAEGLAKAAGETRTPSLMRPAAKGVTDAAAATAATAEATREAIKALEKAPPPTNSEVQGEWAKVLSAALAMVIFFGSALAARLCGLFLRRAREEYVVTRGQIRTAANLKTQSVDKAARLPDDLPLIRPPKIDPEISAEVIRLAPRNRLPRAAERGAVGTSSAATKPAPAPAKPLEIDSESIPSASIDSEWLGRGDVGGSIPRDPEPHTVDSETGRMTHAPRAEIDPASIPLLRALIARDGVESITTKSAAELLRAHGRPMSAQRVSAAINNLHAAGYLRRGEGYHGGSVATGLLAEARKNKDAAAILLGDK